VTNSVKHAQADIIIIHLVSKEHIIRLTMRDNGKGFDFSTVEKKIGNNNHRGIADIQGLTIACNPVIKEYHSHINQGTFYKIIIELKQH
jgi:signal transduction histidine kinase